MRGAFGEYMYARACVLCGRIAQRQEWDESPQIIFCPNCGIELERLACRECSAPIHIRQSGWFGASGTADEFCCFCGVSNAPPQERQCRERPPVVQQEPTHEESQ